ncbi:MAG: QueT transporter family protein [Oscillospiraceae bacterium]|nr:QueT transporter family protein [Oscillospiraceae bacterium]MBQ8884563.1 QueT transporter family protein [Oscillospiraceae bacterium]
MKNVRKITIMSAVSAIYVVLTIALSGLSYGGIQFRVAEALMLLCVFKKEYCVALSVGCLISNMFSPMPLDMVIGTLATVVAALPMYFVGKLYDKKPLLTLVVASLFPAVSNGIIIGLELNFFYGEPLLVSMAQVMFGELVCVSVFGVILFRMISKNNHFMRILRFS